VISEASRGSSATPHHRCAPRSSFTTNAFSGAVLGGDVGMGESWMDGDWSSPDLVSVVRLAVRICRGGESEPGLELLARGLDACASVARQLCYRSRKNISAHYDLSNEFFRLFLDPA